MHFSFLPEAEDLASVTNVTSDGKVPLPGVCGMNPVFLDMKLLEDGQMIRETYEVERFLGEGAFAEVYRVRHRFLGRQAMKVFKRVGMSLKEIEEMLGEAILLSQIGHCDRRPSRRQRATKAQSKITNARFAHSEISP